MTLLIDTSEYEITKLVLDNRLTHQFGALDLSEKLMVEIKKFLSKNKVHFSDIKKVEIKTGSHFSRTRTTVAAANALIFALGIKQKMYKPIYDREPNITLAKKKAI
jgi:tRNA A37 threonylcarbamoyladenosine modification protein TsaB